MESAGQPDARAHPAPPGALPDAQPAAAPERAESGGPTDRADAAEQPVRPEIADDGGDADGSDSAAAADEELLDWVECSVCQKWRKLPRGTPVPGENDIWVCSMNPDESRAWCEAPEESWNRSAEPVVKKKTGRPQNQGKPRARGR